MAAGRRQEEEEAANGPAGQEAGEADAKAGQRIGGGGEAKARLLTKFQLCSAVLEAGKAVGWRALGPRWACKGI